MVIADIRGRYIPEALRSEDYLTSGVFGHLRYIPPGPFWRFLLSAAVSLPLEDGHEVAAVTVIEQITGKVFDNYDSLNVIFWPSHPQGEPDVLLLFGSPGCRPIAIFIEVKLDAGKSGTGDDDQLARYLRVGDSLDYLNPATGPVSASILVFLTPATNPAELIESLAVYGDTIAARRRLFRLDWQDVITAAEMATASSDGISRLILQDLVAFLKMRGLEHFQGMRVTGDLAGFGDSDGLLFKAGSPFSTPEVADGLGELRLRCVSAEQGPIFSAPEILDGLPDIRGGWS